jgi:hypothetical protein
VAAGNLQRYADAVLVWEWLQWRLPPQVWFDAQRALAGETPPTVTTPAIANGLATILDPKTTDPQRLLLLQQLLGIIREGPE